MALKTFAVTAQSYDLEERSNKLFGKGLSQVLQEFRNSPEYFKILAQRVSNWKKSANIIFFSLSEDQTNKFLKDVENLKNVGLTIRQNMKKNKTIFELLDEHSYAQFSTDEVTKLRNLAHEHFNMLLLSYMEALAPGSSNSSIHALRSRHEPKILEKREMMVQKKIQMPKPEVPKMSKIDTPRMRQIESLYNQKVLKESKKPSRIFPGMEQKETLQQKVPIGSKTPTLEWQKMLKTETPSMHKESVFRQHMQKQPEIPKLKVLTPNLNPWMQQKERLLEQKVPNEPKTPKLEKEKLARQLIPKELQMPKVQVTKVPKTLKQDGPVSNQDLLKELEMMQLKKSLVDSIPKTKHQ